MPDPVQRRVLDRLLDVPPGSRLSDLERWRKGPAPRGSGPALVKYLDQAAEIGGSGWGGSVPRRGCRRGGWPSCPATA